ncbi:MAG: hypothetical protein JNL58_05395 [Planctomyces sp.]|nr:hypothetical protein [Planctomyces sp.]
MSTETASHPERIRVAFWNVQNLFDLDGSSVAAELEYTAVFGWDRKSLELKIQNLAGIISNLFDGEGPDLIGLCEIENERIARRLLKEIGRSDYQLAVVSNPGFSSWDTALIYSDRVFRQSSEPNRGHLIDHRFPTCDILEVHLTTIDDEADLMVLVNHWPSRKPSASATEPLRIAAASHCSRIIGDAVRVSRREYLEMNDNDVSLFRLNQRWNRNVLVMGDFNDEPWDISIRRSLNAAYSREHMDESIRMSRGNLPSWKSYYGRAVPLFNPMWSLLTQPDQGTRTTDPSLPLVLTDQFVLSRGICLGLAGISTGETSFGIPDVRIARPEAMIGRKNRPREFRMDSGSGFSDHFPITIHLQRSR